jgi:hypothetical protein
MNKASFFIWYLTLRNFLTVNFETMESAIAARTALNGREILGAGVGAIKIGFAKVPTRSTASSVAGDGSVSGDDNRSMADSQVFSALKQVKGSGVNAINAENLANVENYGSNLVIDMIQRGVHGNVTAADNKANTADLAQNVKEQLEAEGGISEQQMIMLVLSAGDKHLVEDVRAVGGKCTQLMQNEHVSSSDCLPFTVLRCRQACPVLQLHSCFTRTSSASTFRSQRAEADSSKIGCQLLLP